MSAAHARQIVGVVRDAKGRMTHVVGVDHDGSRWTRRVEEILDNDGERWFFVTPSGESMLVQLKTIEGEVVLWNALQGWVNVPAVKV